MKTYQGVAITDGINRKNHIMPLSTLINAYHDSWDTAIPMNIGHDNTKPIGYSLLTGIYMEPGKAYLTNAATIMETDDEYATLLKMRRSYDYDIFCREHKSELDSLVEKLGDTVSENFCVAPVGQAVAIVDKDIIYRLFPEWSETTKDGLVDLRELTPVYTKNRENGEKGFLIPGVYYKDGYLLFAHRFFRRSLSISNSTNLEFFESFEKMRETSDTKLQLAIDMDMVGLLGSEHPEMEYQYIRGPHFNDDLSCIPEGVTCHENEHYDNAFSNLLSVQFYWHIQDGKRTFECEELCDRENISFDDGQTMLWGCKYVHSMINPSTGLPNHLDGAIRIYDGEQILERIDLKTDIKKYGKNSKYIKLWRIDNDFSVPIWKEIISSFYRENALVGEYFCGIDETYEQIKKGHDNHSNAVKKSKAFDHLGLNAGDGIRFFFRYTSKSALPENRDVEIDNRDFITYSSGKKSKVLEAETVTLLKYLKRKGLSMRFPVTPLFEFYDLIYNFPTLCCKDAKTADVVMNAIKDLCEIWVRNEDNRLISFGILINLSSDAGHISFAGHVSDLLTLLSSIPKMSDLPFEKWIENLYQENNRFKEGRNLPEIFSLLHSDRVCFERRIVPQDKIGKIWLEDNAICSEFDLTNEEREVMSQHNICAVPFFRIRTVTCSKCGGDYTKCSCIKFLDENVATVVEKADSLGMIWTNRNASYPEAQLSDNN